ncbi:MAG: HNH endonuclease [Candidatus Marinimicrobia bacterium]|nr:HNH endonuclease [Candidatus Neomarinimicrobiota bacterium]MBV67140.1 HNH endonuclease [Candidatus Neomarinimicrobiota bacterium]
MLNRKVLVLNQSYEPLMVINAKRAIVLIIKEKVKMLEKYSENIRSVQNSFDLPSVIRLNFYVHLKYKDIVLNRRNILKRDDYRCQYCAKQATPLTIDHIVPKNKGGKDSWENLVAACSKCNTRKGDTLLKHMDMKLLKKPRKPSKLFQLQTYVNKKQDNWKQYLFMEG